MLCFGSNDKLVNVSNTDFVLVLSSPLLIIKEKVPNEVLAVVTSNLILSLEPLTKAPLLNSTSERFLLLNSNPL